MEVIHTNSGKQAQKITLLLFVSVIQKFWKAVQICELPYIQARHETQLSKSGVRPGGKMLICFVQNLFCDLERKQTFGIPNQIYQDTGTEICKIHKTGTVPGKLGQMVSLWKDRISHACNMMIWFTHRHLTPQIQDLVIELDSKLDTEYKSK